MAELQRDRPWYYNKMVAQKPYAQKYMSEKLFVICPSEDMIKRQDLMIGNHSQRIFTIIQSNYCDFFIKDILQQKLKIIILNSKLRYVANVLRSVFLTNQLNVTAYVSVRHVRAQGELRYHLIEVP